MMVEIFKYIDRIFAIIRPRKLLYLAIDGVAPRAKMNQQRSRRFRAAQEARLKREKETEIRHEMRGRGVDDESDDEISGSNFDSNCITPGTPFMDLVARSLRCYIANRVNTEPSWQNINIILSDASVPGEGEHKIMDYIRKQRLEPSHDPNLEHVIYGLDADLIMLSMATHEARFHVLREDVFAEEKEKSNNCFKCGRQGHISSRCREETKVESIITLVPVTEKPFIFLRVNTLREYLEAELKPQGPVGFDFNLERALDDWIFLCFFVGNDFLPHLPSLELREGAIDILIKIYKELQPRLGGYICNGGKVDLGRAQLILKELAKIEPKIFEKRQLKDERRIENISRQRAQDAKSALSAIVSARQIEDTSKKPKVDLSTGIEIFAPQEDMPSNKDLLEQQRLQKQKNIEAARALKMSLNNQTASSLDASSSVASLVLSNVSSDPEAPEDMIKLWEPGARERYYVNKFNIRPEEIDEFAKKVARAYVEGLCWVLAYYYRGCASWKWFYPYHYAPFAADMLDIADLIIDFDLGEPFRPFDQLMAVFPADSREHIPPAFHHLMTSHASEIIDFYPDEFVIDLNGKRAAWQGVALLPFIEETRLLTALEKSYPHLTAEEIKRNSLGTDFLYTAKGTDLGSWLTSELNLDEPSKPIPKHLVPGGKVSLPKDGLKLNDFVVSLLDGLEGFKNAIMVVSCLTLNSHHFSEYCFDLLPGATLHTRKLTEEDVYLTRSGAHLRNFPNILSYGEYNNRHGHHSMHRENRSQLQRSDGLSRSELQKRSYDNVSSQASAADNRFSEYSSANVPGPYDFPSQQRQAYSSRYNRRQ